jgi:hypothetical protein
MAKIKYPFDDLKMIVKNNPNGSRADHEEAAFALFGLTGPYAKAIFTYWFDNHIRQLEIVRYGNGSTSVQSVRQGKKTNIPKVTATQRVEAKKRTEEFGRAASARIQQLSLLALTMPNGKELRDCTVAQVRTSGNWMAALCKGRKASEVIGNFCSEKMARDVFDREAKAKPRLAA